MKSIFNSLLFILIISTALSAQEDLIDVRQNYDVGDVVTVSGIVINGEEFGSVRYIQDNSGGGIALYPGDDWTGNAFEPQPGDSITITGELSEFASLLEVGPNIISMTLESQGNDLPLPLDANLSYFVEQLEGTLLSLENIEFDNAGAVFGSSTYSFTTGGMEGVIYVNSSSPLIGELVPFGQVDITGVLSQFSYDDPNVGYQLLPRTMDDLDVQNNINFTTGIEQTNLSTTGFDLNWNTDVESSTEMLYGTSPQLDQMASGDMAENHMISLENLEPGTPYFCQVYSVIGPDTIMSPVRTFSTVSESSGEINVYFNRSIDTTYSTGTYPVSLGGDTDDTIIAQIDRAQTTLDIAVYNCNSGPIVQAINEANDRGVTIRYIAEGNNANTALASLDDDIPVFERLNATSSGMHNKFLIVDRDNVDSAIVLTGSTNWTSNNLFSDPNNMVIIQDQSLARGYTLEFNEMWGSSSATPNESESRFGELKTNNTPKKYIIGGKDVELYFSPSDNTTHAIEKAIETADFNLDFSLLLITNNILANAIIDANFFFTPRGILETLDGSGSDAFELQDAGIEILSHENTDGQLHHKYAIIDHSEPGSDPIVITGSHNWSASAETVNDENTLIIHDADIANQFYQEFMARYNELVVSVAERNQLEFGLYPNPTTGQLNLELGEEITSQTTISIYDISGKKVLTQNLMGTSVGQKRQIDLDDLVSGVYLLALQSGEKIGVQKLVVQ
jgi:phosphatidylserine/phosphatidylglycerophosphate/cardiolipin synthase-like enzyme